MDMFGVLEEQEIAWICLVFLRNKRSRVPLFLFTTFRCSIMKSCQVYVLQLIW